MPEPLRNKENVRDELNIVNGKVTIIRRIKAIYAKTTNNFERRRVNSNGTLSTLQDDYLITDYIDVEDLKQYDVSFNYNENYRFRFSQVVYYDKNKNYLGQENITGTSATFTAVQGAKYVRLGLKFLEEYAVEEGPANLQLIEHGRTNGELCILDKEVVEEYADVNLETFDKDTYIYIREYPNVEYFCRYVIDNNYLDTFATQQELQDATVELNSLIEQKQAEITLLVSRKVGKDEVISSINMTPEKIKILASKLEISAEDVLNIIAGNIINLTSQNIRIESSSLVIDEDGNMIFKAPGLNVFRVINPQYPSRSIYINDQYIGINSDETDNAVRIGITNYNEGIIFLSGNGGTTLRASGITTPVVNQTSLLNTKKNISKAQISALETILNSDIYKYNLKIEEDTDKKHFGLIIDKNYKTPKEIISTEGNSIDMYSMSSISWKAIQELDQKIEKLLNILKKIPILGKIIAKRWKK